jgi:hypothetical protein
MGSLELDHLCPGLLHALARGAVSQHTHIVSALHEPASDRQLWLYMTGKCDQCLEDPHALLIIVSIK